MEMPFSSSGALIKHPSAGLLLGEGPFRESAVPPESGAAFYVNTFRLDDPLPWKIPAALHSLPEPEGELPPAPEIRWEAPSPDAYAQVFTEIMEQIASGRLVKSVPATPQFGELRAAARSTGTHPQGLRKLSLSLSLCLVDGEGRLLRSVSGNPVPPAGPPSHHNGPGRNGASGG